MRDFLKKHNYICLSGMILVTCLVLYRGFFRENVLAYIDHGYDTFHQYVPIYQFFASLLKNGFSTYSFFYGLGTSVFIAISTVSNPFSALNVIIGALFGIDKIPGFLVYNQILKILCAGLLCNYYLRSHKLSEKSSMVASYCFAFSGYMMTAGQHYAFAVHPIYFLILLILVDQTIKSPKKIYRLLIFSFFCGLRSPYSAYMMFLAGAVYTICVSLYTSNTLFLGVKKIVFMGSSMVLGLCTAMFYFLPQAEKIMNSYRVADNEVSANRLVEFLKPASLETLITAFLRLFSNNLQGTPNNWQGVEQHFEAFSYFFSSIFVLFAVQFFVVELKRGKRKNNKKYSVFCWILLLGMVYSVLFNFVPVLFNLFVQPQYRFVYAFLPMFAIMMAKVLDNIMYREEFSRKANWITTGTSVGLLAAVVKLFCENDELTKKVLLFTITVIICGAIALELLYVFSETQGKYVCSKKSRIVYTSLFLLISINLFVENDCTLYYGRWVATKESYDAMQESTFRKAVSAAEEMEGENFYRMETDFHIANYADAMFALQSRVRSLSVYDSRCESSMGEFLTKMYGNILYKQQIYYLNGYNPTGDIVSASTLGLKYLYSMNDIQNPAWELAETFEDARLYRNTQIESAGLLYTAYTSEENADSENISERQLGLTQRVILDKPSQEVLNNIEKKDDVDYQLKSKMVKVDEIHGNCMEFKLQETNRGINLEGKAFQGAELIVPLDVTMTRASDSQLQIYVVSESGDVFSKISSIDSNGKQSVVNCELYECGIEEDEKITYTYSIPYDTEALIFSFEEDCERFEISSLEVRSAEIVYTGEGISLSNPNGAGTVQGTVTTDQDSILYLPIPYDEDWKAMVDEEEVPIYKANYGFCALLISEGTHDVCLSYVSGALTKGLQISLLGCMIACVILCFQSRKIYVRRSQ